jgi:hypothetical protein
VRNDSTGPPGGPTRPEADTGAKAESRLWNQLAMRARPHQEKTPMTGAIGSRHKNFQLNRFKTDLNAGSFGRRSKKAKRTKKTNTRSKPDNNPGNTTSSEKIAKK